MNYEEVIKIYDRLDQVAEILSKTSDQFQAHSRLMEQMAWQIVDLKKRLEVLEAMSKEQPVT